MDWLKANASELFTVFVLGVISVVAMLQLETGGKEIAIAVGGGLVGYLTKSAS